MYATTRRNLSVSDFFGSFDSLYLATGFITGACGAWFCAGGGSGEVSPTANTLLHAGQLTLVPTGMPSSDDREALHFGHVISIFVSSIGFVEFSEESVVCCPAYPSTFRRLVPP